MATLEDLEQMFFIENEQGMEGKEERETGPRLRRSARRFYGLMTHCSVEEDEEGKLWIPLGDALTKQASLKGEAVIVGMRTHAEIWSKSAWEAEINGHKPTPKGLEMQPKPLELQKVKLLLPLKLPRTQKQRGGGLVEPCSHQTSMKHAQYFVRF
jgi:DNA-binding transcriptional regulator/RsmH inhibitor MraZ